jgi:hypothetical protein
MHSRFALQRGCRVLIADEMGLGKTLQVAVAIKTILHFFPRIFWNLGFLLVSRITVKSWFSRTVQDKDHTITNITSFIIMCPPIATKLVNRTTCSWFLNHTTVGCPAALFIELWA